MPVQRKRRNLSEEPFPVYIVKPAGKRVYHVLRWTDPRTGKPRQRSTKTKQYGKAERMAARLADKLSRGAVLDKAGWAAVRRRYESERLSGLSNKTRKAFRTAAVWLEKLMAPETVQDVNADRLSRFAAALRRKGFPETTIASYLGQLRPLFSWAKEIGLIDAAPPFPKLRRAKGRSKLARSRPITGEEFDRILAIVPKVRPDNPEQWQRFLHGLWHSGFRVRELIKLSWDSDAGWSIDTSQRLPLVKISAEEEKGQQDRWQPITREFWLLCQESENRAGSVFSLVKPNGEPYAEHTIVKTICAIGKASGVITDPKSRKFATSHDIGRRAFTTRMGACLSESELAAWSRHVSPQTTRAYYYWAQAGELASKVWPETAQGDTLCDTEPQAAETDTESVGGS